MSMPSKRSSRRRRAAGSSCMIESAVIDLPEPDSPMSPRISPASTVRSMSRRIGVAPIESDRFFDLEQRSSAGPPQLGIEHVAQAVAQQVEAEHRDDDGEARKERQCGASEIIVWRRTASCPSSGSAAARRARHRPGRFGQDAEANWIVACTSSVLAMLGRMCSTVMRAGPCPRRAPPG
jgi:hypothetical protein